MIFIGEWSYCNIMNLISMMCCFYLSSSLKIDVHTSKLLGIGTYDGKINEMASILSCGASVLTFTYLGVTIDDNMSCIANWKGVVDKLKKTIWLEGSNYIYWWQVGIDQSNSWEFANLLYVFI